MLRQSSGKTQYWGLTIQDGPWATTPQDKRNEMSSLGNKTFFGGGVQGAGKVHAGHAGAFSAYNPVSTPNWGNHPRSMPGPSRYAQRSVMETSTNHHRRKLPPGKSPFARPKVVAAPENTQDAYYHNEFPGEALVEIAAPGEIAGQLGRFELTPGAPRRLWSGADRGARRRTARERDAARLGRSRHRPGAPRRAGREPHRAPRRAGGGERGRGRDDRRHGGRGHRPDGGPPPPVPGGRRGAGPRCRGVALPGPVGGAGAARRGCAESRRMDHRPGSRGRGGAPRVALAARDERCSPVGLRDDLAASVRSAGESGLRVVYLRGLDAGAVGERSAAEVQAIVVANLMGAVETLRVIAPLPDRHHLWIVTRGAQRAGTDPHAMSASQASLWGLGRTIAAEHPGALGGLVDLAPKPSPRSQRRRSSTRSSARTESWRWRIVAGAAWSRASNRAEVELRPRPARSACRPRART